MIIHTADELARVILLLRAIHTQEGKARRAADRGLVQMAELHAAEARRIERVLGGIGRRAR